MQAHPQSITAARTSHWSIAAWSTQVAQIATPLETVVRS